MVPEFGVVFSEARLISRVGRFREETDPLNGEVAALRQEIKVLRCHNFLLTKSNFELRNSVRAIEHTVESWDKRLDKIEIDTNSLCASFRTLKLSDDA